jgi:hypothetical protein
MFRVPSMAAVGPKQTCLGTLKRPDIIDKDCACILRGPDGPANQP